MYNGKMLSAQSGSLGPPSNTANVLSWRRLYLNKAKLKAVSRTSALLSGFAMVGMVEISFGDKVDSALLMMYAVNTTLLVAVHLLALMISTCILPNIESVSSTMSSIQDSPHESMHCYIEMAWAFSTGLGILLFLLEIAILCWIKLEPINRADSSGRNAAIVSSAIIAPVGIVFIVFALNFYRRLVEHKFYRTNRTLEELENLHEGLQNI